MQAPWMQTDRLDFRVWEASDIDAATELWGNPEATAFICASGTFSDAEIAARLVTEVRNQETYGVQYWPLCLRDTDNLVGCCGLRPDEEPGAYELGFHLLPRFWGKGIATEAARAAIDHAFSGLDAQKLTTGHNPKNAASAHVLAKLGFTSVGEKFYEPTGLMHPSYELLPPPTTTG